jgi:hypothetical protein
MLHSLTISRAADQALAWLLTYALHSTLLLATAWAATRGLGGRRLRLQETIWRCALLGALVTASAQLAFGQLGHAPIAGRWTLAASGASAAVLADAPDAALVGHAAGATGEAHAAVPAAAPETGAAARAAELATRLFGSHATAPHGVGLGWRGEREGRERRERSVAAEGVAAVAGRPLERALKSAWSPLRSWLLPAWLLGALALTLGHVRSYLALRRRLRYRPQVVGGGVLARLAGLVRQSGLTRRVRLTCTWRLRVPVALGLRAAEVCVPPRALFELDDEQQDALLAHELAHLERRDPFWLPLTQVLAAVFFFQPLNWLARRRLRELSELLSDEWAVARTGRPLSLAGCLAEVAGWSLAGRGTNLVSRHPARLPVPGMADRPSQLAHRIRRLLDGARMAPPPPVAPMQGQAPARRHLAVLLAAVPTVLLAVALAAPGVSAGSSPAPVTAPACTGSSGAGPAMAATAPGAAAACARSTAVASAPTALPAVRVATTARAAASASASGATEVGVLPAARAAMVMAALAPAEGREQGAAVAAEPVAVSASSAASSASAGTASAPPAAGSPGSAPGMAASSSSVDAPPDAEGAPVAGTTPAGASAAAAPAPAAPREHASARDLDAERERLAAAAARLQQLDKLGTLSQEQIAAITAAAERISRDLDGRLREQLEHLNHQLAGGHAGLPRQVDLPAAELAELGAELAGMAAQLHPSAQEMAEIDTELSKLAAEQPHLSAEEIEHIQDEAMRGLRQLPRLGLSQAEIDHLHAEVKRALEEMPKLRLSQADLDRLRGEMKRVLEESAAARSHAMSPADRDKVVADARRLAERLRPDQAQLEALRSMQREHEEMTRILAKQRAEIEAMRREILHQTQALRDQARRLTDVRRAHPRSSSAPPPPRPARPASPAAPAAPPATAPPAAPESSPAPDAPPPPDAPPAPDAAPPPASCAG